MFQQLKSIGYLILYVFICFTVGYIGNIFTQSSIQSWYPTLTLPAGTPSNSAFAPIWILLYLMMGVSLWWASLAAVSKQGYALFSLQLLFNLLWPFLFFGLQNILLGMIDLFLLDICVAATIYVFWEHSKAAAMLLVPYFLWILYASYLNIGILILN